MIDADWQPLPPRAKKLFAVTYGAVGGVVGVGFAVLALALGGGENEGARIAMSLALFACVVALFIVVGIKRFRSSAWRMDDDGFAWRRGRLFFRETRIPASRVQHLDLKHSPFERRWKLATLVIHTAGSKMSAVSVMGLGADDAEALRDRLARQLDDDDAL